MTPDDPRHGRRAGYLAGCRSTCCTIPNYRASKKYKLEAQRNGGRTTVDPAPVRAHIQHLQTRMSLNAVADIIGSSASHLRKIVDHAHPVMHRDLAERILAVTIDAPVGTHWVDATGSRRRIQALAAIGYSFERLATMTAGCGAFNLRQIAYGERSRVRFDNAREIHAVFDRITREGRPYTPRNHRDRTGAERMIRRANASGWVSALAWDEGSIDDPQARPVGLVTWDWDPAGYDETRIERRINGDRTVRLHKGETAEVVRRLRAAGVSSRTILRDYGIKAERYTAQISATQQEEEVAA